MDGPKGVSFRKKVPVVGMSCRCTGVQSPFFQLKNRTCRKCTQVDLPEIIVPEGTRPVLLY